VTSSAMTRPRMPVRVVSEPSKSPPDTEMGATELNTYGSWNQIQPYGWVWIPPVAVGWAPYHYGRWVWREPWGWTWVSYEPWGWLPYHYGRWVVVGTVGWIWVPGTAPWIWTPGCVRFYYGPTWVSWVPLGPHEIYYHHPPPEHRHFDSNLINAHVPGATAVISRRQFVTGIPEDEQFKPPKDPIRSGRVAVGPPPVVPTRASLNPAPEKVVTADRLPPPTINRPVVYSRPPSAPPPLFEHRVKEIHRVVTKGLPPAAAPPSFPARRPPAAEGGPALHKDIIVREVKPSILPKQAPRLPEKRVEPSGQPKTRQPSPPKSVKLPRPPSAPSAPGASAGGARQVRPLYQVPPQSRTQPPVVPSR